MRAAPWQLTETSPPRCYYKDELANPTYYINPVPISYKFWIILFKEDGVELEANQTESQDRDEIVYYF
jgi:hypothetical protein